MTPQGPPCRSRSGAAGGKHVASRAPPAAAPWRLIKGTMRHAARGRARAIRRRVRGVGRRVVAAISSTRRRRCIRSAPRPAERSGGDRSARSAGALETIRFNRGDRIQGLARVPSCERQFVVYCRGRNPRRGRTRPRRLTNWTSAASPSRRALGLASAARWTSGGGPAWSAGRDFVTHHVGLYLVSGVHQLRRSDPPPHSRSRLRLVRRREHVARAPKLRPVGRRSSVARRRGRAALRREFAATICKRSGSVLLILSKQSCLVPLRPPCPAHPPNDDLPRPASVPAQSRRVPAASSPRPAQSRSVLPRSCPGPASSRRSPSRRSPQVGASSGSPPRVPAASRRSPGGVPQVAGRRNPASRRSRRVAEVAGRPLGPFRNRLRDFKVCADPSHFPPLCCHARHCGHFISSRPAR